MQPTTEAFVTSLIGIRDWNAQNKQLREWAAAGRMELLLELGEAISSDQCPERVALHVRSAMLEEIVRSLAGLPVAAAAETALACALFLDRLLVEHGPRRTPERLASRLAYHRSDDTLEPLFGCCGADPQHREVLACLVQEILLRRGTLPSAAAEFHERQVAGTGHPLGYLPLRLLPAESLLDRYLPRYGPEGGSGWSLPDRRAAGIAPVPSDTAEPGRWTQVKVAEGEARQCCAAVQHWCAESNGITEVGVFSAGRDLTASTISASALLSLPLECLASATTSDVEVTIVSPADALSHLFAAASNGGAYNSGLGGAYGRLAAWRSLAALAGVGEAVPIEDAAAAAERCTWITFAVDTDWFHQVAWDLGLLAIHPDRRTVAALAATDTD